MIKDTFFNNITFSKLTNAILVYCSYLFSIVFRKVFIWGYPYAISVEPSSICNLSCPECPAGNNLLNRDSKFMSYSDFAIIIDQVKKYTIYLNLYLQGEPFLNNDIFRMIKYANENNIFTSTSTNGHFLNPDSAEKIIESGLKKIIISLDGTDQETYEKYRKGGTLSTVLKGIETLTELKIKKGVNCPEIVIQFIVFRHNEHQVEEIKRIVNSQGINKIELKSAQVSNQKNYASLIPKNKKFSRYIVNNDTIKIKSSLKNRCFRIWETLVITSDGNVVPCCFDKSGDFVIGSMKNNNLYTIWKTLAFNGFRKKILDERKKIPICCNCSEGLRIRY